MNRSKEDLYLNYTLEDLEVELCSSYTLIEEGLCSSQLSQRYDCIQATLLCRSRGRIVFTPNCHVDLEVRLQLNYILINLYSHVDLEEGLSSTYTLM